MDENEHRPFHTIKNNGFSGILSLNKIRGNLSAMAGSFNFHLLKIYGANMSIHNLNEITITRLPSDGIIRLGTTDGKKWEINSSKFASISIIRDFLKDSQEFTFITNELASNSRIFSINGLKHCIFNKGRYQAERGLYNLSTTEINATLFSNIGLELEYFNGTKILQFLPTLSIEIISNRYISIEFNSSFVLSKTVQTSISFMRFSTEENHTYYNDPSYLNLVETTGNLSIGPRNFIYTGYDDISLINSYQDVEELYRNFAIFIQYYSLQEFPYTISFKGELDTWESYISQLIINDEIQYESEIVLQNAPSNFIKFDSNVKSSIEMNFIIYNPTRYDILSFSILFDEQLGNIFQGKILTSSQKETITISIYDYGIEIPFFPANSIIKMNLTTNSNFFELINLRKGNIIFFSDNSPRNNYSLTIEHTNVFLEIKALMESQVTIAIIGFILAVLLNSFKDELKKDFNQSPLYFTLKYFVFFLLILIFFIISYNIILYLFPTVPSFYKVFLILFLLSCFLFLVTGSWIKRKSYKNKVVKEFTWIKRRSLQIINKPIIERVKLWLSTKLIII